MVIRYTIRNTGVLPQIYEQLGGNCSLFAAVAACSTAVAKKHDIGVRFSAQYLQDSMRAKNVHNAKKDGVALPHVLRFIENEGLILENDYRPFNNRRQNRVPPKEKAFYIMELDVAENESDALEIEMLLREDGNVLLGVMKVWDSFDDVTPQEVYKCRSGLDTYRGFHSVVLTGVGEEDDSLYYEIMNSHGQDFCDGGFAKDFCDGGFAKVAPGVFVHIFVIKEINYLLAVADVDEVPVLPGEP